MLSGLLLLLYPVLVYFGLQVFSPRVLVLLLLLMAGLRWLAWDGGEQRFLLYWMAAILIVIVATLITGSEVGLLYYPLLMSMTFLAFFSFSLINPPTVVELIARKQHEELPPAAVLYTRTVTQVWCGFFVFNGAVSIWSVSAGREAWLLYNGMVSYCLMALVMGIEYLVRRRVMEQADV